MSIPDYQSLMLPVLSASLDGEIRISDVVRLGRKTRIPEPQRKILWSIFERVRAGLKARQLITHAQLFNRSCPVLCRPGRRASNSWTIS